MKSAFLSVALFLGFISFAVLANIVFMLMIEEINRLQPKEKQISWWFGYPGVLGEITRLHKRMFPKSDKRPLMWVCMIGAGVHFVLFAWSVGFFDFR